MLKGTLKEGRMSYPAPVRKGKGKKLGNWRPGCSRRWKERAGRREWG